MFCCNKKKYKLSLEIIVTGLKQYDFLVHLKFSSFTLDMVHWKHIINSNIFK